MFKRIFACILILVLMMSFSVLTLAENTVKEPTTVKDGYSTVAENTDFRLLANMSTGDFAIEDKKAGRVWYSGQWDVLDEEHEANTLNTGRIRTDLLSVIGVNYVQISTIASTAVHSYQNSYAYSVIKGNSKTTAVKNGIKTEYYFKDIDSSVPVEITLTDKGFSARIIGKDIKMGDEYYITSIELLPGMMASDSRYNGYLFVPSGSGAIVPLNYGKGDIAAFSEMVYGDDAAIEVEEYEGEKRNVLVPIYGIKTDSNAIAAVISEGDSTAKIRAESNSSTTSFTRIFSEYVTAIIDSTTLFESDYSNQRIIYGIEKRKKFSDYNVDYYLLRGDKANYSGMAETYRNTIDFKGKACEPQLFMTLYGAATKKASFLGIPYTKTISLTSFNEAKNILNELNGDGISVSLQYVGWNNNGIENKKADVKFNPVKALGGKSDFKKLQAFIEQSDNSVFYDVDSINIRKSGRGFSVLSDVSKSIFNTRTPQYKYMRSVYVPVNDEKPWYLLTPANMNKAAKRFLENFKKQKGGISFNTVGEKLYSDFYKNGTERAQTIEYYQDVLESAKSREICVNLGNSYTYPFIDKIYNLPMTSDGNLIFSQSIPFVQMILHGSISYSAEKNSDILDCIEYGASPYYAGMAVDDSTLIETNFNWLSGSTYKNRSEEIKALYKEYSKVYENLFDKKIVSHTTKDGIATTVFENGVKITVNRSKKEITVDGKKVAAKGFCVTGG